MLRYVRFLFRSKAQKITETGEFPCPHCQEDRTYSLIAMREVRGFIDAFMPNSGDILKTFVDCQTCGNRYPGELRDAEMFRDKRARLSRERQ